jgi:exopolyphosphatase/guanosine-5'-triphosphate,3'-diphosphate pyrophosphatase
MRLAAMTTTDPTSRPLAAIDIGTNTIRLLVASPVEEGDTLGLRRLATRTATVRLGYGVERTGQLDPERLERAVATIEEYRQVAADLGADPILLAATSAVRDAENGPELRERIAATSGLDLQIVAGDREAALTFAGATAGQSLAGTLLVADLGGGSLELIVSQDGAILSAVSLQLGSGRLTERHVHADPPDQETIAAAQADARAMLDPQAAAGPAVDRLIIVGGTATSIPVLVPRPNETNTITVRRLAGAAAILTGSPVAELAAQTGLDPERVRTLPAGVAIIGAILAAYGLDAATVGSGGIREGLLLDHLRNGDRAAKAEGRSTPDA